VFSNDKLHVAGSGNMPPIQNSKTRNSFGEMEIYGLFEVFKSHSIFSLVNEKFHRLANIVHKIFVSDYVGV